MVFVEGYGPSGEVMSIRLDDPYEWCLLRAMDPLEK